MPPTAEDCRSTISDQTIGSRSSAANGRGLLFYNKRPDNWFALESIGAANGRGLPIYNKRQDNWFAPEFVRAANGRGLPFYNSRGEIFGSRSNLSVAANGRGLLFYIVNKQFKERGNMAKVDEWVSKFA